MDPISVKITRAERRGRKVIIVFESDLYSDETFAFSPFNNEGDLKNQLESIQFDIKVSERSGKINASVSFGNCLSHFTKGHSQMHAPLNTFYLSKKDCALNWVRTASESDLSDDRVNMILGLWENDKDFFPVLSRELIKTKQQLKKIRLEAAKKRYHDALENLDKCLEEI